MIFLCFAAGFLLSALCGKFVIPALVKLKFGQSIKEIGPKWHLSKNGTPTMGGIIFIIATIIVLVISCFVLDMDNKAGLFVLAFSAAFGIIGFTDDFCKIAKKTNTGLTALQKLVFQILFALIFLVIMKHFGYLSSTLYIPFINVYWNMPWILYLLFAVFAIIGTVNAVNLTDGVDGLATGVTIPIMIFFCIASLMSNILSTAVYSAALCGALVGFLLYNFNPAKVFMGDTGSLFLGGAVCGLAFAIDIPVVIIICGVIYVVEALSVCMQVLYFKLTHGKRIFKMTPIHHHFEMCGWKEKKIFFVFTGISTLFSFLAWLAIRLKF